MRPIDRSGAERLPPEPPRSRSSARPTVSRQSTDTLITPSTPPSGTSNRCTLYVGPPTPTRTKLQDAWQTVENTLFDAPLDAVAALGREFIEAHLERAEVTRAVQNFAPFLKESVQRISPQLLPRWPALDHYADAVRLVHAFGYAHAPDKDMQGNADYDGMCRHGKALAELFAKLGRTLARQDDATAAPLMRTLSQRWTAYRHHQQRWQRSLQPATWSFPAQRLELNEAQVHAVLVEPRARLINVQNLPGLFAQLMFSLLTPPVDYGLALEVLKDMGERLVDINPDDKNYIAESLDIEEFRRREALGVLTPETILRSLAFVGRQLPGDRIDSKMYRHAEEAGWPMLAVPEAMIRTYDALITTYNIERQKRLHAVVPTIAEEGVAWERKNFAKLLQNKHGKLPNTETWLARVRALRQADGPARTLQMQHATALAELLVQGPRLRPENCPETLVLSSGALFEANAKLTKYARIAIAGEHFKALGRAVRVDINPSDVEALQTWLLQKGEKEGLSPLMMANEVLDEFVVLCTKRKRLVDRKELADAHLHDMLQDLADFDGPYAPSERQRLAAMLAPALVSAPLHDPTGRGVGKVQRTVEEIGKALQRLARIDYQVHSEYYALQLASNA